MSLLDYTIDHKREESGPSPLAAPVPLNKRREPFRPPPALHPTLAFLTSYGVAPNILMQAAAQARRANIRPEQALLAAGLVSASHYYQSLARHLGLRYIEQPAGLGWQTNFPQSILAGVASLPSSGEGAVWLLSPEGRRIDELLTLHRRGVLPLDRFALTQPAQMEKLVIETCAEEISAHVSHDLAQKHGRQFSAQYLAGRKALAISVMSSGALVAMWLAGGIVWLVASMCLGLFLAASILVRLFAAAASCDPSGEPDPLALRDDELPNYTVIAALYREANVAAGLVAALNRLDYPAGRLDIKLVVEAEDHETRAALEALGLPARYQIISAPEGIPRTKPRALNVALPLARGSLVCVFDAEDVPEPMQLREAAGRFAALPGRVACLQGRLAIDNHGDGWLARCFAIEYAALFDVTNPGLSALGLPVPLGGTSNHFRTDVLREIGGWDAWNVTEDIDLGLRLARFGYQTGVLDATTFEEAPAVLFSWMRQRRRWFKGWIQTFIVHFSDLAGAFKSMGAVHATVTALHLGGTLAGAMLGPAFAVLFIHDAIFSNLLQPAGYLELAASTCWCFVAVAGVMAAFWPSWLGLKRRGLLRLASTFPLLPLYWLLLCIAAWWALADLFRDPFKWLKTEHGLARNRMSSRNPAGK